MQNKIENSIIFTNKARCRDCYRCVRACPVKAVKMENGQAFVNEELCIFCGTCVKECPQGAKQYRNDVAKVQALLSGGERVAVTIAPSFAAVFNSWEAKRIPSALRKLGFCFVSETAVGAYHVAKVTVDEINSSKKSVNITSACPAVVNYIEKYKPSLIENLTNVSSPMISHAGLLKTKLGDDIKVVFIGPCIAKKSEAARAEYKGLIEAVLTFEELRDLLDEEGIIPGRCEESGFDEEPLGNSRIFALSGGQSKTAECDPDLFSQQLVPVSGYDEVIDLFDTISDAAAGNYIIEPLFCRQGCINGPGCRVNKSIFEKRNDLLKYYNSKTKTVSSDSVITALPATFTNNAKNMHQFTEEEIKYILAKTGKTSKEDELNCGACGYSTCRDKAAAVLKGMAELEMCIPYVRRMAEQRTDKIIESSPNGIVILDDELNILNMNPAFKRFFMCGESLCGKNISYLMDPEPFVKLKSDPENVLECTVAHDKYSLVCHEKLYMLEKDRQYVGIFVDITRNENAREQLDLLKAETVTQAKELLDHQINFAQQMAKFLGENTAKGEKLVDDLMKLSGNNEKSNGGSKWLRDLYGGK